MVSGMTAQSGRRGLVVLSAAMEPARGERDDIPIPAGDSVIVNVPQWSPLVVSGMTSPRTRRSRGGRSRRNGARSW